MDDEENLTEEAFMDNIWNRSVQDIGYTAVGRLLHAKDIYLSNTGDSRSVGCRIGKALDMNFHHKPENQIEFDQMQKVSSWVIEPATTT